MSHTAQFRQEQGIFVPERRPHHRDDQHDDNQLEVLMQMQREHFWYRGRHKFLLNVTKEEIARNFGTTTGLQATGVQVTSPQATGLQAIDMGGGCGGWLEYVQRHAPSLFQTLDLGDSSMRALVLAEPVVGPSATRYQIDLLDLPWTEEWDVVFLLDVLEHIPDHAEVLRQVRRSMRPGGLLFVTTPALKFFWTHNDEVVRHQRRYSKPDFRSLAELVGLQLLRAEYFMFLLSPVLLFSRALLRPPRSATPEQLLEHFARTHNIPPQPVNDLLTQVFAIEAAMVRFVGFPWGTSILAVFRR